MSEDDEQRVDEDAPPGSDQSAPDGAVREGARERAVEESPPADASATERRDPGPRRWLGPLAFVVLLASLFGPIATSGIWDPHELEVADLSRRIAVNLLGAEELALEGASNDVPTLGELSRGELPLTSVALGFRAFGLHDWAGRVPLAIWAVLGAVAMFWMVRRLADRAAASFAVLVLATTPLFFLHGRTMLGDAVTMSACALATAGFAVAVFDRSAGKLRPVAFALGCAGALAGFLARGALVGVAVPALGVGVAHLVQRFSGVAHEVDRTGDVLGALTALLGAGAAGAGVHALAIAEPDRYSMLIGAAVSTSRKLPTHDAVIHQLGHALVPWSAVAPFAAARILRPPPGPTGEALEKEAALRWTLLSVASIGLGAFGLLAPATGVLAYSPVFAVAAIVALCFRDSERGAPASLAFAAGIAGLAVVLYAVDFKNFPEKAFSAYAVEGSKVPESFVKTTERVLRYGTLAWLALFLPLVMEHQPEQPRWFVKRDWLLWPEQLRHRFQGNLMFGVLVAEAALIGFAVLTWLSDHYFHWEQFERMSAMARSVRSMGWWVLPLALLAPFAVLGVRDALRWVFGRLGPITRPFAALCAVCAFGLVLSLGYYPALARQVSPKQVFESYRQLAAAGDELGMIGAGAGAASYYAGQEVPSFANVDAAFDWLMAEDAGRRWLVVRSKDLPQLNSKYRAKTRPSRNVPVLDARSSEILLVSNRLVEGETNQNPFDQWLPDETPKPTHATPGAHFGDQLAALGWDVTTPEGQPVSSVVPGESYHFRIYYRVDKPISGNWQTFVHIDGFQRRFNGDHDTLEGRYPLHLWRVGDHVVDIHPFRLQPNFTPGRYRVYYGLFIGDRRLPVKNWKHHENRLDGGELLIE